MRASWKSASSGGAVAAEVEVVEDIVAEVVEDIVVE